MYSEDGISEGTGSSVRHSPPFCVRCQKLFSAIVTAFLQLSLIWRVLLLLQGRPGLLLAHVILLFVPNPFTVTLLCRLW